MKKIITIIALCFIATVSKAITYDTVGNSLYARIQPVKANFSDTANSVHLGITSIYDNGVNTCTLLWYIADANYNIKARGNYTIDGALYTAWNGDNDYIYNIVANYYGLTLK